MVKYKVGDIFINHADGKILQVCEGSCNNCLYRINVSTCSYGGILCRKDIGSNTYFKELPSLPPGTRVKVREDLKVRKEYGNYIFNYEMEPYTEVTISCYDTAYNSYQVFENFNHYPLEMFDQVINEPKENNMETKEIKIDVPEGYEIDKENSTFECIKLKPIKKELTYEDVAEKLFSDACYYTNEYGKIDALTKLIVTKEDKNNATNKKQLEKILALNQLLNIAEYYNRKSSKEEDTLYYIIFNTRSQVYYVSKQRNNIINCSLTPTFNSYSDASAVINNSNFKNILDLVYKDNKD